MSPNPRHNGKGTNFSDLLEFHVPADSKAIGNVTDRIIEALEGLGIAEEKRLEIQLAVQEALANAVVHGCKNDPAKEIHCRVQADPAGGGVLITVTDPGPGFSPDRLADPKSAERVQADHGRGIYLIRELMDEVSFQGGGNQITMRKY